MAAVANGEVDPAVERKVAFEHKPVQDEAEQDCFTYVEENLEAYELDLRGSIRLFNAKFSFANHVFVLSCVKEVFLMTYIVLGLQSLKKRKEDEDDGPDRDR